MSYPNNTALVVQLERVLTHQLEHPIPSEYFLLINPQHPFPTGRSVFELNLVDFPMHGNPPPGYDLPICSDAIPAISVLVLSPVPVLLISVPEAVSTISSGFHAAVKYQAPTQSKYAVTHSRAGPAAMTPLLKWRGVAIWMENYNSLHSLCVLVSFLRKYGWESFIVDDAEIVEVVVPWNHHSSKSLSLCRKTASFAPLHLMVCSNIDNRVARESRHLFLQWRFVGHEVIFWNKKKMNTIKSL